MGRSLRIVGTAPPWHPTGDDVETGIGHPHAGRQGIALGLLFTAVKVALAFLAILVVFPAAMAAQAALAL